jgi:hypothetical protein
MDFLSANRANLEGVLDPAVLACAAQQDRVLVTSDFKTMPKYFGELLQGGASSPGVFLVKQHAPIAEVIDRLVLVWAASDAGRRRPALDRELSCCLFARFGLSAANYPFER